MEKLSKQLSRQFSDIDLDFVPHPNSGDIVPLYNTDAVKRSIRNLLLSGLYERPYAPDLGGNLKQLLFEPINPITEEAIRELVLNVVRLYEPRATIIELQLSVTPDELGYDLTLIFAVDNISEIAQIDLFLERLR